jgi:hypothetical protein
MIYYRSWTRLGGLYFNNRLDFYTLGFGHLGRLGIKFSQKIEE